MATPRSVLVDPDVPLHYHITSRCVQKAWLLGPDPVTGKSYMHRKKWLIDRFKHLAKFFSLEICAYAIMSNHFHMVVYFNPTAARTWSDEEVARRWVEAFPPRTNGKVDEGMQQFKYEELLESPVALDQTRKKLGSLSCFMQHLKQPIARRANLEVDTDGDFWSNRFYSGALLDEEAVFAAMVYVDLNPVRARIAKNIHTSVDTSIFERLRHVKNDAGKLDAYLKPIVSGLETSEQSDSRRICITITLKSYSEHLEWVCRLMNRPDHRHTGSGRMKRWLTNLQTLGKKQRAYGQSDSLTAWLDKRYLQNREATLV